MSTKLFKIGLYIVIFLTLLSCGQRGVTHGGDPQESSQIIEEEEIIVDNRYTVGVITQTEGVGNCEWVIRLKDGRIFETSNLKTAFKKDGNTVNFKYRGLRRLSECEGATPVEITEINMNM